MPKKSTKKHSSSRSKFTPTPTRNGINKFFYFICFALVGIAVAQVFFYRNTFRIGLNLELSGDRSAVGQSSLNGAQLAIDQLNAQGGIVHNNRKYKIEMFIGDNYSDPQLASTVVQKLMEHKPHALIGPNASALAIPAAIEAEKQQVLMISPWSTSPDTTLQKQFVFRTAFTDQIQMKALVKFSNYDLKATRVAVLYDDSADVLLGQAQFFRDEYVRWGGAVVAFNALPADDAELTTQLNTLKRLNPQVVFLPAYEQQALRVLTKAKELGFTAIFIGSDAWEGQQLVTKCGTACDGTYVSAHFSAQDTNPAVQQFVKDYQEKYQQTPDDVAALSYDTVQLIAASATQATELHTKSIVDTLKKQQYFKGLTGEISYSEFSNDPTKSIPILKLENGQMNWVTTLFP